MLVELGDEVRGHPDRQLELTPGRAQQAGLVGIERGALQLLLDRVQQLAGLGVGEDLVRALAQGRDLAAARLRALRGHVGGLVPAQQRGRRVEVVGFDQAALQAVEHRGHRESPEMDPEPPRAAPLGQ